MEPSSHQNVGINMKLLAFLGAGGQGEVYDVKCGGSHYALKWYFKGSATARQKKILETIVAKGSPDPCFSVAYGNDCPGTGRTVWICHASSGQRIIRVLWI